MLRLLLKENGFKTYSKNEHFRGILLVKTDKWQYQLEKNGTKTTFVMKLSIKL